ncbi:hypothetical protein KKF84_00930 [Myxococcota bacterium]|nr:hypothetical protein [Myxococcota bacterium]MBU1533849.1 hypothetical protein [Myxococcota bacterium]
MADTRTIMENKVYLLILVILSLALIVALSTHLSRRPISSSVSLMHTESNLLAPKEKKKTSLELLMEKRKMKMDLGSLAAPLKRHSARVPATLSAENSQLSTPQLLIRLNVTEKNYKMGQNDRFLVTLAIENRSSGHLVYRVLTEKTPSFVECISHSVKRTHHGFILKKGESVERFEGCAFSRKVNMKIIAFQVMELPEAGLLTLARIETPLGIPPRLEKTHKPFKTSVLGPCPIYADKARLNKRIANNPLAWFEIMDFFARNDCSQDALP